MDISRPALQVAEPFGTTVAGTEPAAGPQRSFAAVLAALEVTGEPAGQAPAVLGRTPPVQASLSSSLSSSLSWQRLADSALTAEGRIDSMIEAGRRGKAFTASELIGLQMEVFRYSQTVEVISRTTDKIIGALKQVLGTQV